MKLLLVHRYFHPDVPTYAQMLRFIGQHLHDDGHDVSVFCGPVSYNGVYTGPARPRTEVVDGLRIHRVGLRSDAKNRPLVRAMSMLVFALRLVAHVLCHRGDYDLITVTTIPPVVMGMAARVIASLTGIPYVYHCMDLYPEVAEISGLVRLPVLARVARRLDTATCRHAAAVVVLSEDMRATLVRRGLDARNVVVLNNFEVLEPETAQLPAVLPDDGRFRVLFAGNMGRFQGVEDLIEVARRLAPTRPDVEFVLMGAGSRLAALKEQAAGLDGVRFVDHQPVAVAADVMARCDLGVISLRPRIHEVAYPSKTAMYLTAGCRLVAVVESSSDLARLVRDDDLGVTCQPGDVDALAALIAAESDRGRIAALERKRYATAGDEHFGRAGKLARWSQLVDGIAARRA